MHRSGALRLALLAVAVALTGCGFALTGCGFVASGERGANKPDTFLLHGYVSVGGVAAGPAGSACEPTRASADIRAGGAVRAADNDGHTLGAGQLAPGVLSLVDGEVRCNFGFEIPGVPGGVDRYVIGVGNRPPVAFPARELRENKPAVLMVP